MHPASIRLLQHFDSTGLPDSPRAVVQSLFMLAEGMAQQLDSDDPVASEEVAHGLRHLLQAQECFLRARRWLDANAVMQEGTP